MNGIKANINIDMTAEHRQKISDSKIEYHIKMTKILLLIEEINRLSKDLNKKKNNSDDKK